MISFKSFFVIILVVWSFDPNDVVAQVTSDYQSNWPEHARRHWIGPEYWANRLQDWQLRMGRLECIQASPNMPMRTVHLLTHELSATSRPFQLQVRTGTLGFAPGGEGESWSGFLIGAGGGLLDFRAASLVHHYSGEGGGIIGGFDDLGRLVFRSNEDEASGDEYPLLTAPTVADPDLNRTGRWANWEDYVLTLSGQPQPDGTYHLTLSVADYYSSELITTATLTNVSETALRGNIALVSHGGSQGKRYWFRDFQVSGEKIVYDPSRTFGPVLNAMYSVHTGILKMNVQFPPLGFGDATTASMYARAEGTDHWIRYSETHIESPSYTALFRIEGWDASQSFKIIRSSCIQTRALHGALGISGNINLV